MNSAYDFTVTGLEGQPLPLQQYRGQPLLVNVASRYGFRPVEPSHARLARAARVSPQIPRRAAEHGSALQEPGIGGVAAP